MKKCIINYKRIKDDRNFFGDEFRALSEKLCCENMKDEYESGIYFGEDWEPNLCITRPGYDDFDCELINYCPWCGAKIECIEKEVVKKVYHKRKVMKEVCETTTKEIPVR